MYSYNKLDKPCRPALSSSRILDQLRERLRYMHYSLQTEKSYVYWVRWYIRWHGVRHPKEMGGKEVEAFLSMLANERKVSPSTHRQALSALLFLYKEVLEIELPWMQEIGRPSPSKHIPVVLTVDEVSQVLTLMHGVTGLLARLIYGTGLRLREALSLRIKDVDFDRKLIIVREGKGGKDRVVMLPTSLISTLKGQVAYARAL
jgi:integrase